MVVLSGKDGLSTPGKSASVDICSFAKLQVEHHVGFFAFLSKLTVSPKQLETGLPDGNF